MLEDGKIDELKAELRDEIYKDSLKQKPDVKRRYTAMMYHPDGKRQPLTIQTSIGICVIMPVYIESDSDVEAERIIDVEL